MFPIQFSALPCMACLSQFLVCLNFSCLSALCVCVSSPPSVRVGLGLSARTPPLQLPYFIRGHQLSSLLYCQSQTSVFSFFLPLRSLFRCFCPPSPLAHCPSSSLTFFILILISHTVNLPQSFPSCYIFPPLLLSAHTFSPPQTRFISRPRCSSF